jgi:hypothetical protein
MNKKYIEFPIALCEVCANILEVKMNKKKMIEYTCAECGDFVLCYQLETLMEKKNGK